MSFVHCIIIRDGRIALVEAHWRAVKCWLETGIPPVWQFACPSSVCVLDEGYVVIDCDRKVLFNCQEAFAVPDALFAERF